MTKPQENRYTVRYRNHEGAKIDICVAAENVTEAIEVARHEVPALKPIRSHLFCIEACMTEAIIFGGNDNYHLEAALVNGESDHSLKPWTSTASS